ncbi:MAG: CPBP family intramembrane metalloprotease [Blautia sp.]|nr:CPBP family intramembrane metalloprotease [Lachnoclostridium sp.]MCM1211177.1 CPBP family intramembrane metalloprotease [Blautia sp.]
MDSKKANWLFLTLILVDFAVLGFQIFVSLVPGMNFSLSITAGFLISEGVLMAPALLFVLFSRNSVIRAGGRGFNDMLGFRKIKISSFFMVILFTFLIMPMTTAINAISMIFVDNAVTEISGDILKTPFVVMLFLIGIYGPFCEEFVFRGVIFRGYKNSAPVWCSILWSALLFGLMHMNFNQAAYAIAIGIMFALLVEATGSLWASAVAHMVFNSEQVCMMYLANGVLKDVFDIGTAEETLTTQTLLSVIGPYLLVAVVATSFAVCVLVWLAKNEGREMIFKAAWDSRRQKGGRIVSIPLIIAIVLCLAYMSLELVLEMLLR